MLQKIEITIHPGELIVLTGPSGSGKSLFLRALALLDPLDTGDVFWNDQPIPAEEIPEFRSRVMYLHQRDRFSEETVEAVLKRPFSLRVHQGRKYDSIDAQDLLQELGRDAGFLNQKTSHLSGGESRVVALARVLLLNPNILLLDEPTAGMDAETTRQAEQIVTRWIKEDSQQRACLWVSHEESQMNRLATRRLRMSSGQLIEDSMNE
ncbi:MAG: ATP-binding cassette domain-containing protein [Planctomycetaceae bacterium]